MIVPDELLLLFFDGCTTVLLELDCQKEYEELTSNGSPGDDGRSTISLPDSRKLLLDRQKACLHRAIFEYEQRSPSSQTVNVGDVQSRLSKLKLESNISSSLNEAMVAMEEAARTALCMLMLYSELRLEKTQSSSSFNRQLQITGNLERSRLMEFIGLCQSAVRWKKVQDYLRTGQPLFADLTNPSDSDQTQQSSAMKFPQARLEHIQRCLSRAVSYHPELMTKELKRIFFDKATASTNEFSSDKEVLMCFEQLVSQMNVAVTNASLQSPEQLLLSDKNEGGVTSVVSVQYSEVDIASDRHGSGHSENAMENSTLSWRNTPTVSTAPRMETMKHQDDSSEADQKRDLRLATEAAKLQQILLQQLQSLPENERNKQLVRAKQCSDDFLRSISELPPGPERILFLQSIDPETSRLLALHKLWASHLASKENN